MVKRLALILAVLTAGVLGAAAVNTRAQAMPGQFGCDPNWVCVFTGQNFSGTMYAWDRNQFIGTCVPMQGSFDQTMSSFLMRATNAKVKFYGGTWCTSPATDRFWIAEHQHNVMETGWDNWARSFLLALP